MNKIELPQEIKKTNIPTYMLVNGGETVRHYLGKDKHDNERYKDMPVRHIGPDGVYCSDDDDTFVSWDRLGSK